MNTEIIKKLIKEVIDGEVHIITNLSDYLSKRMGYNYSYLAQVFSEKEGKTIARFTAECRVERIKNAIIESPSISFGDLASATGFNQVPYLANFFKKETGMTINQFKISLIKAA